MASLSRLLIWAIGGFVTGSFLSEYRHVKQSKSTIEFNIDDMPSASDHGDVRDFYTPFKQFDADDFDGSSPFYTDYGGADDLYDFFDDDNG